MGPRSSLLWTPEKETDNSCAINTQKRPMFTLHGLSLPYYAAFVAALNRTLYDGACPQKQPQQK